MLIIYSGIVRTLASICFSSSVGRWVDRSPDRLKTLMSSITLNRLTVITCCTIWIFIVQPSPNPSPSSSDNVGQFPSLPSTFSGLTRHVLFATILLLGIGENLSASGNMMSMERDWVVVAAAPDGSPRDTTHLNSAMRRIDLICKLIAPILISFIISATNTKIGVIVVAGMSTASWAVEMLSARHVWNCIPALQALKIGPVHIHTSTDSHVRRTSFLTLVSQGLGQYVQDFKNYFHTTVWIPSLSLSLLHLSALSYGATFITFLLSAGFSLDLITIARAVGSLVEISSTVVTPFGVHVLGKARNHGKIGVLIRQRERASSSANLLPQASNNIAEESTVTGLQRLGLWGLCWQLLNLVHLTSSEFLTVRGQSNTNLGPCPAGPLHPHSKL
jgi:iron-regulated transporter 1